jgi:phytoene synthase
VSSLALVRTPPAHLARQVIAHHGRSFSLASKLLPARARDDAAILYAWCRRADDAVDGGGADRGVLARLADELDDAYAGRAREPLLEAFGAVARRAGSRGATRPRCSPAWPWTWRARATPCSMT